MDLIFSNGDLERFIEQLDAVSGARVDQILHKLEKCGYELRMPHSKSIGNGIYELRVRGAKHIRILYATHNNRAILLHIFLKKTWSIPKREVERAIRVLKLFLA